MSKEAERVEYWVNINKSGADFCGSKEEAEETKEPDDLTYRLTERRDGETVVGPLEMAVIEAAKEYEEAEDDLQTYGDHKDANEEMTKALILESDLADLALKSAVRALREARKPKETTRCDRDT